MSREAMDTNCMTLTRFILAEQKKYAPGGTGIYRKTYGKGMNIGAEPWMTRQAWILSKNVVLAVQ